MRSSIILILALLLFNQYSICQTKAKITDVDFQLEDRYIVINYNLTGSAPKEEMTIELKFFTENNETIIPKTVTGDIGTKIFGDGKKAILWDIVTDSPVLSGNLKATVTITYSKVLFRGPSNALASILIPGLGGYFVDKNKARSVLTTISSLGLIAYGVTQKIQADKYYADYQASTTPSEMDDLFAKANGAQHSYYMTTRIGAGIWALDIIWVTFKGFHNKKVAKSYYSSFNTDGLRLNYVNNGVQLGYSVTF
jgi:hypothetical protein